MGYCWTRPDSRTPAVFIGWLQQMRAVNLLVSLRTQLRDDQISLFIKQKKSIPILNDKSIRPSPGLAPCGRLECLPNPFTRICFQTPQLAVTAHPIDVPILQKGCAQDRIQMRRFFLACLLSAPSGCCGGVFLIPRPPLDRV